MGTWGKDGSFYNDEKERIRADARWLQQERQNKELEKQNDLKKKEIKALEEKNKLMQKQLEEQREQSRMLAENNRIMQEQTNILTNQERNNVFMKEENEYEYEDEYDDEDEDTIFNSARLKYSHKLAEEVFPLMYDAEINEPMEYWQKLMDLYINEKPKKPEKKFLKKLPKNISLEKIKHEHYIYSGDYVRNLDDFADKQKIEEYIDKIKDIKIKLEAENEFIEKNEVRFNYFVTFLLIMFLIPTILCAIYFFDPVTMSLSVAFILLAIVWSYFLIRIFANFIYSKKEFESKKLEIENLNNDLKNTVDMANKEVDRIKEKIEAKNIEIKKQNDEIMNAYSIEERNWENKIRNFEKRRIEDFNYLLEIALEKLSQLEMDFGYSDEPRYILKFYDYPENYEKYKENYFKGIEEDIAKENGTEMFLDLEE